MESVAAQELRSIVARIERLHDERDGLAQDIGEVYSEAKSRGFEPKALKAVIAERRKRAKGAAAFDELQAIIDLYRDAIAAGTPSATRVRAQAAE